MLISRTGMIARIRGILEEVGEGSALLDTGNGLAYEVLVPAGDTERLGRKRGQEIVFHTLHYVEGDPARGSQTERLVGFLRPEDRDFFRTLTTVKGIGIRKALRALSRPIPEVAAAIQAKDIRYLVKLPEIGKRTAEQLVLELHERMAAFAGAGAAAASEMSEAAQAAVMALVSLGERRSDAVALIERVHAVAPEIDSVDELIRQAFRIRGTL